MLFNVALCNSFSLVMNTRICRQNLEVIQNDMDTVFEKLWQQYEIDERDVRLDCTRQVIWKLWQHFCANLLSAVYCLFLCIIVFFFQN